MQHLRRDDLFTLEKYAEARPEFRAKVMAHKKNRQVPIGDHATLYFEDRMTIQYQIQEMLRVERIFEAVGIEEELESYNPLIPDGSNWKATFMIEYEDEEERRVALGKLMGIEEKVWVKVSGFDKVHPVANEDLERSTAEKTSAVHFLRFELSAEMIAALKSGAALAMGCDHENYRAEIDPLVEGVRGALTVDLA